MLSDTNSAVMPVAQPGDSARSSRRGLAVDHRGDAAGLARLPHHIRLVRCGSTPASPRDVQPADAQHATAGMAESPLGLIEQALDFYGLSVPDVEDFAPNVPFDDSAWFILDVTDISTADVSDVAVWTQSAVAGRATVVVLGLRHGHSGHAMLVQAMTHDEGIRLGTQPGGRRKYRVPLQTSRLTGVLAGAYIPWTWPPESPPSYFDVTSAGSTDWLPLVEGLDHDSGACAYAIISRGTQIIESGKSPRDGRLVLVSDTPVTPTDGLDPDRLCPAALIALLTVRIAAGRRCWHHDGVTANFTIDDPNLVEPYGRVSYNVLARSMRVVGYHTTVAFIPWNRHRTERSVTALFASDASHFSLAVHGNDHDGYEFATPSASSGDTTPASQIAHQRASVAEALVRMRALTRRTGVSFSPVMVFPHGIGSVDSILELDHCGYLASANRQLVPSGANRPARFDFGLRPADDTYASFPLMQRWWPSDAIPELAAFFGKPVLLYAHERDFAAPLSSLEKHVARLRRIDAEWCDLTGTARSLYLERDTGAGETEIWMFSREVDYTNHETDSRELTFFRTQADAPSYDVSVNGAIVASSASASRIVARVTAEPGECVRVRVLRRDPVGARSSDDSPTSAYRPTLRNRIRIALRRHACELRDRHSAKLGAMLSRGSAFAAREDEP